MLTPTTTAIATSDTQVGRQGAQAMGSPPVDEQHLVLGKPLQHELDADEPLRDGQVHQPP